MRTAIWQVKRALVEDAAVDTVGMFAVLWQMKHVFVGADEHELREAVLAAIHEALDEGCVVAGRFGEDAMFQPWREPTRVVLARIEAEWKKLGHELHAGDVCWFVSPARLPVSARAHPSRDTWRAVASPAVTAPVRENDTRR